MGVEVVETDFRSTPVMDGNEWDNTEMGFPEFVEFHPEVAVNERPKPKKIHTFYFVKYPSYKEPELKSKFDEAHKYYQETKQAVVQITEAINKIKYLKRYDVSGLLWKTRRRLMEYRDILNEKTRKADHRKQAPVKLRNITYPSREEEVELCSSEEELNYNIRILHSQMQRGRNTLVQEKNILRAIHQLEGTREKVIANAPHQVQEQEPKLFHRPSEPIVTWYLSCQAYRKFMKPMDLDGFKKEMQKMDDRIKYLEERLKAISSLEKESTVIKDRNDAAYRDFWQLEKQREEENAKYSENCSLLKNVRDLAAQKSIRALKELSRSEVEKFMSLWSSNKAFRDDFVKRISASLDRRQLTRDGRMRNPDENPMVLETDVDSLNKMKKEEEISRTALQDPNDAEKQLRDKTKRSKKNRKKKSTLIPATILEGQTESDVLVVDKKTQM